MIKSLVKKIYAGLALCGLFAILLVGMAFTGHYKAGAVWLETAPYSSGCDYILLLPSGPIPSPDMLMRAYRAAEEYGKFPASKIVISNKIDSRLEDSASGSIRRELMARGVPPEMILLETKATSTYDHARYIKESGFGDPAKDKYLIVTSPSHIKRSMLSFKAQGFKKVFAAPAFSKTSREDMGEGYFYRYQIWKALIEEVTMIREFVAIAYYKLTGKI